MPGVERDNIVLRDDVGQAANGDHKAIGIRHGAIGQHLQTGGGINGAELQRVHVIQDNHGAIDICLALEVVNTGVVEQNLGACSVDVRRTGGQDRPAEGIRNIAAAGCDGQVRGLNGAEDNAARGIIQVNIRLADARTIGRIGIDTRLEVVTFIQNDRAAVGRQTGDIGHGNRFADGVGDIQSLGLDRERAAGRHRTELNVVDIPQHDVDAGGIDLVQIVGERQIVVEIDITDRGQHRETRRRDRHAVRIVDVAARNDREGQRVGRGDLSQLDVVDIVNLDRSAEGINPALEIVQCRLVQQHIIRTGIEESGRTDGDHVRRCVDDVAIRRGDGEVVRDHLAELDAANIIDQRHVGGRLSAVIRKDVDLTLEVMAFVELDHAAGCIDQRRAAGRDDQTSGVEHVVVQLRHGEVLGVHRAKLDIVDAIDHRHIGSSRTVDGRIQVHRSGEIVRDIAQRDRLAFGGRRERAAVTHRDRVRQIDRPAHRRVRRDRRNHQIIVGEIDSGQRQRIADQADDAARAGVDNLTGAANCQRETGFTQQGHAACDGDVVHSVAISIRGDRKRVIE